MRENFVQQPNRLRLMMLGALLLLTAACGKVREIESPSVNDELVSRAVIIASEMNSAGQRVWCVPFARNASGIDIHGNANTWWRQSAGVYERGHAPIPGAVMAFSGTGKLPMGHIAVVSEIVSDREILIDHANWSRNQVSLDMSVIDVSRGNDWSSVRVMSNPGAYGSVYRIDGFISRPQG
ncbi:CHAP domain-containing protein [Pseudoruegeria sp. HB172150]|uniref:CHAP domain-containing protein n=1 Tax=Pseudoruegeria sp. HB172150 TaxID=2721164 RepID=UPI0020A6644B|nr:CHAP domain-containing protein [Pseudoruegeria sp. HB172150]